MTVQEFCGKSSISEMTDAELMSAIQRAKHEIEMLYGYIHTAREEAFVRQLPVRVKTGDIVSVVKRGLTHKERIIGQVEIKIIGGNVNFYIHPKLKNGSGYSKSVVGNWNLETRTLKLEDK
jgi:hypothetical protein